jgi:NAD(P)-dependent dehydrogenase (short-subunit alcohol dehydrogenase family)
MRELEGKTAFVTGAASGIGFGIAAALARAGVKVMLCDIEAPALEEATSSLRAEGCDVDAVKADVSLKAELKAAAEATQKRFGKVHVLVNNAGIGGGGAYGQWTDASWDWTIAVNLMSVVWGFEIFGPLIESHGEGGHVVSTASMAGLLPGAGSSYGVTKAGVVSLSEGLRRVLAPKGIGVSVLCPGLVNTRIVDFRRNTPGRYAGAIETVPDDPQTAQMIQALRAMIANGVDPHEVGKLVLEGVRGDWPYIFTDAQFEPMLEARFAEIRQGFDRIRERTPKG